MVGRVPGQNVVMLEDSRGGTCITHSIVLHELFHKIGLWHEQMRFDRDDHITVKFDNIAPSKQEILFMPPTIAIDIHTFATQSATIFTLFPNVLDREGSYIRGGLLL